MNFDFSAEQQQLRDQVRRFLEKNCTPLAVRARLDGAPLDRSLWKSIADLGWLGTVIPEEYGGLGLTYVDLCVIAEEIGRCVAPLPFSSSAYLATGAILLAAGEKQKESWLPALAEGSSIGTFALSEGHTAPSARNVTVRFDGSALSGTKLPVIDADCADFAIVAARDVHGEIVLCRVDLRQRRVTIQSLDSVDPSRPHSIVTFENAPAQVLTGASGWVTVERVIDSAAVLLSFEQIGGAQRALEMARDHSLQRRTFGRQIGSYQAIKHKLADMWISIEIARSNAYYGAWALENGPAELSIAAAAARVAACEAYWLASKENIQTHGGVGFTWEFDCHLYYRRAALLGVMLGSPRIWKDRLIDRLVLSNAA
ncbi:acyl-CoA dehydrogenase family protein [Ferrovibrio sp.]|uniref:acyl-CoA dehydrogenase family protein n=1 Tax=Ferrovibrio sp. TaxID=1917215 RepID=UPI003D2DA91D